MDILLKFYHRLTPDVTISWWKSNLLKFRYCQCQKNTKHRCTLQFSTAKAPELTCGLIHKHTGVDDAPKTGKHIFYILLCH